jgi:hypothetical protein
MNICVSPYGNMNWCVLSVFILGLWAAGRLMLWLVVLSISQWFFVLYSIKNPRLSTTCLHNRYFKVTSFYSSSCSISRNTPPENLHEPAPKLVSQDDLHRKSSIFSGFHLNLQGCTLWYPQHVESTRQLQTTQWFFPLLDLRHGSGYCALQVDGPFPFA